MGVVGGVGAGPERGRGVLPVDDRAQPALRDVGRAGDGHGELLDACDQRHVRRECRVRHEGHGLRLQFHAPGHRRHRQQAGLP